MKVRTQKGEHSSTCTELSLKRKKRELIEKGTSLLYLPLIYYKLAIYINRKQTLFSVIFVLTIARLICLFKYNDNVLIWITPLPMIEAIFNQRFRGIVKSKTLVQVRY